MKISFFIRPFPVCAAAKLYKMTTAFLALLAGMAAAPPSGAAAPASVPASYLRAEDHRVAAVVHRLATRGTAFCEASHPLTGMALHHLDEYETRDQAEAVRQYGLDKGPGVVAVVAGSPAAEAGIRAGDLLLRVNGVPLPTLPPATKQRKPRQLADAADGIIEAQGRTGTLQLDVLRDGARLRSVLKPFPGCAARGRLARSNQPNAFADGRYAIMTTKMLDFVASDDELAVVMAHELSHNLLRHPQRLDAQKVPHGILRGFGKNAGRVRVTEEEADRLSLKLLWAAGYDASAAIPFWRRLYARYDPIPIPKFMRTHPSLGAREQMIRQTIEELGRTPAAK